jgi:hypothetical protein
LEIFGFFSLALLECFTFIALGQGACSPSQLVAASPLLIFLEIFGFFSLALIECFTFIAPGQGACSNVINFMYEKFRPKQILIKSKG